MWPNMRKQWFGKNLLYGFGTLIVSPIKILRGVNQFLGLPPFFCNITCMSSSLQIELVSVWCLWISIFYMLLHYYLALNYWIKLYPMKLVNMSYFDNPLTLRFATTQAYSPDIWSQLHVSFFHGIFFAIELLLRTVTQVNLIAISSLSYANFRSYLYVHESTTFFSLIVVFGSFFCNFIEEKTVRTFYHHMALLVSMSLDNAKVGTFFLWLTKSLVFLSRTFKVLLGRGYERRFCMSRSFIVQIVFNQNFLLY